MFEGLKNTVFTKNLDSNWVVPERTSESNAFVLRNRLDKKNEYYTSSVFCRANRFLNNTKNVLESYF